MKIIELDDTVRFHRPVGETTQVLPLFTPDSGPIARRPAATGEQHIVIPRTIGIVDGPAAGEPVQVLPTAAKLRAAERAAYAGRHRAPDAIPVPPPVQQPQPGLLVRALARVGINIARVSA